MSENNTHWRTFHETVFLGSADLEQEGIDELTVKIKAVTSKTVKDDKGREETVLTCSFEGLEKPMILNATNCKSIEKVSGSPFIDKWSGVSVTIYILRGIRAFGKVVDGLRIKDQKPKVQIPPEEIQLDVESLTKCKTMDELKKAYSNCKHPNDPKVSATKNKQKDVLDK